MFETRVLSGMRPTGALHLGHYHGVLKNWVRLQAEYPCLFFVADWHALTTDYENPAEVQKNGWDMVIDWLAAGIDPNQSILFLQSAIPEHAELHLLLSMMTPLGWLERVPTYKEALENVKDKDLHNYGCLGYPVLQCADIVMYSSPDIAGLFVPTGEDQVSHVETSREIARRFNTFYGLEIGVDVLIRMPNKEFEQLMNQIPNLASAHGWKAVLADKLSNPPAEARVRQNLDLIIRHEVAASGFQNFIETCPGFVPFVRQTDKLNPPESMLTKTPKIPGLDGRKMSKSYGNTITLSETDEEIRKKTKVMVTDPARKRRTDPGNPDVCPVYDWHKLFSAEEPWRLEKVRQGCTTAGVGCIKCNAPVRERRMKYEKNPKQVLEILDAGSKKARTVAQGTMERVREAVFGWSKKRKEIGGSAAKA